MLEWRGRTVFAFRTVSVEAGSDADLGRYELAVQSLHERYRVPLERARLSRAVRLCDGWDANHTRDTLERLEALSQFVSQRDATGQVRWNDDCKEAVG